MDNRIVLLVDGLRPGQALAMAPSRNGSEYRSIGHARMERGAWLIDSPWSKYRGAFPEGQLVELELPAGRAS
jgi:hypothetical protein